jgi:RNA polymerase sigma factor (TIGR02999 family)
VIRHILIDYERRRVAEKRGGGVIRVPLEEGLAHDASGSGAVEFLALDAALQDLATHEPRLERVVECRFFGGLTGRETAEALGVSVRTVERDWARARAYLRRAMRPSKEHPE